jgi:dephospho-CoA kinase
MRLYGLTGGIATGKSTVSRMFREEGVPIVDADLLAREVVESGQSALAEIAAAFPFAIAADGQLNRRALADHIFAHPEARLTLEAITHPRIRALATVRTQALADVGHRYALYDAPLLFERNLHLGLAGVIVVVCGEQTQLARLMARDALSLDQAKARVGAQLSLEAKRALADWVIDNDGSLTDTRRQVQAVFAAIDKHV